MTAEFPWLNANKLAEIDREIAAMPVQPSPDEVVAALLARPLGEKIDVSAAVQLLALYRGCSAVEAQEELAAAIRDGHLDLELAGFDGPGTMEAADEQ